ncbi:alcohol dehydrogenase catalytic domain-containing protein [Affinibrenneria salicis]|uniref:Alcohol dehydrogenase catalytic domain-containing protein n=1 Tax=Affinibrenneria salicis TaxID=2590031 RepID=A0A5J5G2D4_9GAMM|nr:alcohol dehydrogenase catalytic domain-containing protein [Affinibrenneria salicis]KAA9000690.1 alcohol dehydrogenase catalytic domain-containing protein [Affinibrenneria salicis]
MIPATMKAAVLTAPRHFELQQVAVPVCGDDDVLIRVSHCSVCGTDVHIFNGHYSADKLPLIPGHEFAGEIVATGARVSGFNLGQRVIADINIGCGHCFYCRHNEILNCKQVKQIGIHMDGAFAEYVAVPARLVIPLNDNLSFSEACLTEPFSCVVRAHKKIGLSLAESVVIIGAGAIGNMHIQMARLLGAAPIIALELNPQRAELALRCGADVVISEPEGALERIKDLTEGRGADVVIESVGHPALYQQALTFMRPGGRLLAFGLTEASTEIPLKPYDIILKEQMIQGSVAGMGEDMYQALQLLSHQRFDTTPFCAGIHPLDEVQQVFDQLISAPRHLKMQLQIASD